MSISSTTLGYIPPDSDAEEVVLAFLGLTTSNDRGVITGGGIGGGGGVATVGILIDGTVACNALDDGASTGESAGAGGGKEFDGGLDVIGREKVETPPSLRLLCRGTAVDGKGGGKDVCGDGVICEAVTVVCSFRGLC